jgi:hypothetical protein
MRLTPFLPLIVLAVALPAPAHAYMGPGLGLGAMMTSLGVLGGILLGLISILWYPAKRLARRLSGRNARR